MQFNQINLQNHREQKKPECGIITLKCGYFLNGEMEPVSSRPDPRPVSPGASAA